MSTVTTRLCQYGHQNCYKHMSQTQVVLTNKQLAAARAAKAKQEQNRARCQATIAKIEEVRAEGWPPKYFAERVGWKGLYELRRMLQREGRDDLAALFYRPPRPRCALKGCGYRAVWIEDKGLDETDEPIAHWGYLCAICQKAEDLAEDLLFLLDPRRGAEINPHRIAGRLGYGTSKRGVESLRRALERHGRLDLRDMLHPDWLKDRRGWVLQGTLHSPRDAQHFTSQVTNGSLFDSVGGPSGLEGSFHTFAFAS